MVGAARASDAAAFQAGIPLPWEAVEGADPAELSRVLGRILGLFEVTPLGVGGQLAVLAGLWWRTAPSRTGWLPRL